MDEKHLTPEAAALAFAEALMQCNDFEVRRDLPVQVFEVVGQGESSLFLAAVPVMERFEGLPDPVATTLALGVVKADDGESYEVVGMMQPAYDQEDEPE